MILQSTKQTLLGSTTPREVDLFINTTGYEERASSLVRLGSIIARYYISLRFENHRVLDFAKNQEVMEGVSARFIDDPARFFRSDFCGVLRDIATKLGRKIRLGLDVSSMNRTMAATAISSTFAYRELIDTFDLFYLPAKFKPPKLAFSPIEQIGPVTPELSGFDAEPGTPLALVLGVGYEFGTAIGLISRLEPQMTICLKAIGSDPRYVNAVREANLDFDFSAANVEISEYDLLDFVSAYRHIENIVYTLVGNFRVVMVPMGPKILSALMVLIALKYFGKIAIWRVARPTEPAQVTPDRDYVVARVDVNVLSQGLNLSKLRDMIEGRNLTFLAA